MALHQHHPYVSFTSVMHYPPPPASTAAHGPTVQTAPPVSAHAAQHSAHPHAASHAASHPHAQHAHAHAHSHPHAQQQQQQQQQSPHLHASSVTVPPSALSPVTGARAVLPAAAPPSLGSGDPSAPYAAQQQPPGASSAAAPVPQSTTPGQSPLVAQGDWTKNLVHLAKTAELKKHALTLQLHTAHILSAHSQLQQKNKALQDIKEQRDRLDSERTRLLNCLCEVNKDRDKADLMETKIIKEVSDLHAKIQTISDGEYAAAKREVDQLREELGQPKLLSLQQTLEENSAAYLNERRLNGTTPGISGSAAAATDMTAKHDAPEVQQPGLKRKRGRPKGSKNKRRD